MACWLEIDCLAVVRSVFAVVSSASSCEMRAFAVVSSASSAYFCPVFSYCSSQHPSSARTGQKKYSDCVFHLQWGPEMEYDLKGDACELMIVSRERFVRGLATGRSTDRTDRHHACVCTIALYDASKYLSGVSPLSFSQNPDNVLRPWQPVDPTQYQDRYIGNVIGIY